MMDGDKATQTETKILECGELFGYFTQEKLPREAVVKLTCVTDAMHAAAKSLLKRLANFHTIGVGESAIFPRTHLILDCSSVVFLSIILIQNVHLPDILIICQETIGISYVRH